MLLRLASLERSIAGRALFAGVDLDVRAGDRVCVVGPNGAGKSTLLRIAAGLDAADGGEVVVPRGVRVGLLRQEIDPRRATSVRDEAATALAHLDALEAEMRALERAIAEGGGDVDESLAERYDAASARFHHADGFARDARVDAVLEGLGFDGAARARPLSSFSGGWLMRVELAKLLLSEPDVLLLDEPTNHLDLPAIEWFESVLDGFAGAVVAISHDRAFLRRQARRIAELDGLGHCTVYEHDYDGYLRERERRREERLALRARQDRQIAHLEQFVDRFRAKATKARQAQSRLKAIDRIERVEIEPEGPRGPRLRIPEPPRSGRVVLELEGVAKRYGDQVVYDGLDFAIERGERVALVGPNGAGKSTLLRIAAGALAFDAGERALGHNVETAYFAQHQLEALDARRTILEELGADASLADHARLRGHLGAFLFSGDDVQKRIGVLSGGEKARVALAKMLLRPCNLLVLDEPTNHLDTSACEVLEQALASYAGTLLFVSHDRSFINAIATRIVEVRPGEIRSFPGTYDDYRARLRELERGAADPGDAAPASAPSGGAASGSAASGGAVAGAPARAVAASAPSKQERIAAREADKARQRALGSARRRLETLEGEIAACEAQLETLGHRLGDPALYAGDGDAARAVTAERDACAARCDALYRDWERAAAEIEAIEDASRDAASGEAPARR